MAKAHGGIVETAALHSRTWPDADAYDQASAIADRLPWLDDSVAIGYICPCVAILIKRGHPP